MRGLILPRRFRKSVPAGKIPRIDWSNPVSADLIACYVPGSGTLNNLVGLGGNLAAVTQAAQNIAMAPDGPGLAAQAASRGATVVAPSSLKPSTAPITIFWRGIATADAVTDQVSLGALRYSSTYTTSPYVSWGMARGAGPMVDNDSFCLQWARGTTYENEGYNLGWSSNYNVPYSLCGVLNLPAQSWQMYVNGNLVRSAPLQPFVSSWNYTSTSTMQLGCVVGETAANGNTITAINMIFTRPLTAYEVTYLSVNPFALLIYDGDDARWPLTGSPGVTPFSWFPMDAESANNYRRKTEIVSY